jgi:hypothetical protein
LDLCHLHKKDGIAVIVEFLILIRETGHVFEWLLAYSVNNLEKNGNVDPEEGSTQIDKA